MATYTEKILFVQMLFWSMIFILWQPDWLNTTFGHRTRCPTCSRLLFSSIIAHTDLFCVQCSCECSVLNGLIQLCCRDQAVLYSFAEHMASWRHFFSQITLKLAEKKTLSEEISTVVFQEMCMDCRLSSKLVSPSANVFTKYRALSSTHPYYTLQNLRLCKEQIGQHSVMRDLNGQTAYQVPHVNSPTTHYIKTSLIKSQLPPPY